MTGQNNKPCLKSIPECAKLIDGVTEKFIRQKCSNGELPCIKAGRKFLINPKDLFKLVGIDY